MSQETSAPLLFADLGLSDAVHAGGRHRRLRNALADPGRHHSRCCWKAATCWARPRPAPARPPPSRCRSCPASISTRPSRRRWCWRRRANWRSRSPRRSRRYAAHIPGFHVLPIYGGQSYGPQLQALRRGVHVIVGTPGRVIDHLESGTLDLSRAEDAGAGRSRRNAAHGLHRRRRSRPEEDRRRRARSRCSRRPCRRRSAASRRPTCRTRPKSPSQPRPSTADQHPPALLAGQRHAQARRADPHPGSRTVRRHDHLRAHQAGHRRTGREAAGARLRRGRHQRRHRSRPSASAPSSSSRTARSTSWSPPTSPRAAWTWSASAT